MSDRARADTDAAQPLLEGWHQNYRATAAGRADAIALAPSSKLFLTTFLLRCTSLLLTDASTIGYTIQSLQYRVYSRSSIPWLAVGLQIFAIALYCIQSRLQRQWRQLCIPLIAGVDFAALSCLVCATALSFVDYQNTLPFEVLPSLIILGVFGAVACLSYVVVTMGSLILLTSILHRGQDDESSS